MDKQDNAGHMEFSCLNSKNKKKQKKKNIACVLYKHVHVLYSNLSGFESYPVPNQVVVSSRTTQQQFN